MDIIKATCLIAGLFTLAACGSNDLERGASGAAIGAVAAHALGQDAVVGAAVGATAGVLCDNAGVAGCQ